MNRGAPPPLSLRAVSAATLFCFGVVSLLPVATILYLSLRSGDGFSLAGWRSVMSEGRHWTLLRNSLGIAGGTALLATLLGAVAGFALEYVGIPGRRVFSALTAVPFLIPSYVSALAWIDLLGQHGLAALLGDTSPGGGAGRHIDAYNILGVILVQSLSLYPIVALSTILAIRRLDRKVEEAAELAVGRGRVFLAVTLPLLAPGILSGALFVFLLGLVGFAVPSLLQVSVYPVEIYSRFNAFYDLQGAAALSVPLVVCGLGALAVWLRFVRPKLHRLAGVPRERVAPAAARSAGLRASALAFTVLLLIASAALPLAVLFHRALPLQSFAQAWQTAQSEIAASLTLAASGATCLCLLGFAMAYLVRCRMRGWSAASLAVLPFLVSGPVLGVALIAIWNHPGAPALVYDGMAVVVLACVGRFLFFAHHGIALAMREVHRRWEEAATVAGVPWWRQVMSLFVPYLAPALIGAWGLAFLFCMTELDATVLVCPPGFTTLPVRLFTLMHYGPGRLVAALSLIFVSLILAAAVLVFAIYSRVRRSWNARG